MQLTKDQIREMFWHEVNGLERPEEEREESYELEGIIYENPTEIIYMNAKINWSWVDESFDHAFGIEVTGYFDPEIKFAEIIGENREQIMDITNIVR